MKNTLLLCFIHGFKGGESTFGEDSGFTENLKAAIAKQLPKLDVQVLIYPKYETRGDLGDCVSRFREWLQNKVIDIEVEKGVPSPTVDPSVHTILLGHSMGGIVAAETVIGITSEKPIYTEDGIEKPEVPTLNSLMFPYIQGVLAFDTPYLGISPGVVAHGAEGHYQNAAAAISQLGGMGTSLWGAEKAAKASPSGRPSAGALMPPPPKDGGTKTNEVASPWQKWGKMAMYAGAAGAVAAGGAAAWLKRDQITEGWSWVSSHMEFVGCLARKEELKKRVNYMVKINQELGVGFANMYTRLGKAAPPKQVSMVGEVLGKERTFCNLPSKMAAGNWQQTVNDQATDETTAHMGMFEPKENPAYEQLTQDAANLITAWVQSDWYQKSFAEAGRIEEKNTHEPLTGARTEL